ncbi:MAG: hypothetical protein US50_C0004G0034 [Candidatus Nomurabacteria bacterium GW2011_GWB1_37_5]|uniref:UPF0102 protein US50_C0004G0034 n=1 Tax=Candidatus Nomurabacteria bacterium GW2011_GWB1_37_5 TaxID=1618742 RepID=A0A0G0HBD9_9BACT|nr:MAG: hypothetical protein US50_C0004G0034 [Candidatus Nomurabacteria bacterium GW2011_GWB1_37_5]
MPHIFTSKSQKKGQLGEDIACKYLEDIDYRIIERNYTKKWGELDIVAFRDHIYYFIEVKSVSCEITKGKVTHVTNSRPESNIDFRKVGRLKRAIQTYMISLKLGENDPWKFEVISVFIDRSTKKAKIRHLKDIIL